MSGNTLSPAYTETSLNMNTPPLTDDETKAATEFLVSEFPRVARHKVDPPVQNQSFAVLSYMLLEKPVEGVHGFAKVRGVFSDAELATQHSEKLIKEHDSLFKIHIVPVGHWVPVSDNERFSSDRLDVKSRGQEMALRDRAAKEAEDKNKEMQRELKEQKEQLEKDESDVDNDPESLDYYTKKRVTEREIYGYIQAVEDKAKMLKKSLKKVREEIVGLNKAHPTYDDLWLENYNTARRRAGLPAIEASSIRGPEVV